MSRPRKLARPASHAIFDLDGVLLDTESLYTRATQIIVEKYGRRYDWSIKADIIGRGSSEAARRLVEALELPIAPEEYLRRRRPLLEAMFKEAPEAPGAERFVRRLHARSVAMAVATSSERAHFEVKVARHAWFELFASVVCSDDGRAARPKPAPDLFLVAAEDLGAPPEHCVVFEDSPSGVAAARAAGMQVVALPDPAIDPARLADADLVVTGFDALDPADLGL